MKEVHESIIILGLSLLAGLILLLMDKRNGSSSVFNGSGGVDASHLLKDPNYRLAYVRMG